ncbi:MAG: DUF58 domain-containing protein [Chloroflexota bacterium]
MRSGRIFVALLVLLGVIGVVLTGQEVYSRVLYLGLMLVLVSAAWTWLVTRPLKVQRRSRSLRASVGDMFEEHFEVRNGSLLLNLWIEVHNQTSIPGAAGSRLLTLVGARQKRTYMARSWLTRRGAFPLGPTSLTSGDPFGLFRIRRQFPAHESLIVMPMIFDIPGFLSPPGLLPGGQVIRRKATDVTPHASGVREYVPGDPMKRIHWTSTARRGQMMVKEFEQDPQAEIWLFVDAQEIVHFQKERTPATMNADPMLFKVDAFLLGHRPDFHLPPSTLEYSVSMAASLAHYFLGQRRAVGLITSGRAPTMIPAERGERQESKILETLAFVEAEGALSLAGLVAAQGRGLPQGSSAILITPSVSSELLAAVDDLQRRHLRPVVLLLIAETFGGPRGSDRILKSLSERRVPVCPIYCDADLGAALASFSATYHIQEPRTWERPPSPQST